MSNLTHYNIPCRNGRPVTGRQIATEIRVMVPAEEVEAIIVEARREERERCEKIAVDVLNSVAGSGVTTPADAASRILQKIRDHQTGGRK